MLPNFIIAGAPRSGTTYLYDLLDAHPSVYLAKPRSPEPKFFLRDDEFAKGLDYYRDKYFAEAEGYAAVGEKSTNYLESPQAARRMRECVPDVKLMFVLRNPIERAFSNYRWSSQNGLESLSFEEAIEREAEREAQYLPEHRYSRPFSYVSRGRYAQLLTPYFELFPRDRIEIVLMDDIMARPRVVERDLLAFLNVPPGPTSFDLGQRINEASFDSTMLPLTHERLRRMYFDANRALEALVDRDLKAWDEPMPASAAPHGAPESPHAARASQVAPPQNP
jgi:hypothetical protein